MHFFKSLQSRIVVLFVTLILVVQFIGFAAIWFSINTNARAEIVQQLKVGEALLKTEFENDSENLSLNVGTLAADYGFREAISTNDDETIVSALDNLNNRLDASVSMLYGVDSARLASASEGVLDEVRADRSAEKLIQQFETGGQSHALVVFDGKPYRQILSPVKAPITVAYIVAGFEVDGSVAKRVQSIAGLDVSFFTKNAKNQWELNASTLKPSMAQALLQALPQNVSVDAESTEMLLDNLPYGTHIIPMVNSPNQTFIAVMQSSINEALAPYLTLQINLLILTVLGALVFIAGSIFTARRVTKPLSSLAKTAEQLEKGDYSVEVIAESKDEVGDLARTFERMRSAIAEREQKITKLAFWDTLTNLPNRADFTKQLESLAENFEKTEETFSVLMMDINRFKHVNDILGHATADILLKGVAERLAVTLKDTPSVIARIGGDEFGIILPNQHSDEALKVAYDLRAALEMPIALNDSFVDLSAGFGIANFPEHTKNVELLIGRAEIAMYSAKQKQIGAVVYQSRLDVTSEENLTLSSQIKQAVEQNQLLLFLQPKIDFKTGKVLSAEALVRWMHPERGMLSPDQFIPFAEQTNNISQITHWMINESAKYIAEWQANGLDVGVAVNISARDLIDIDLPNKIADTLNKHQLYANSISLEITESSIMEDPARALDTVERIARMGIHLSIDDFGTGYSSLAYLKRLPLNELKIDRSFINNIERDHSDEMIVRSTIELGHNLGLKVVAEGIETKHVWNMLKTMGCDFGQGYLMSKPMPAANFASWHDGWQKSIAPVEAVAQ